MSSLSDIANKTIEEGVKLSAVAIPAGYAGITHQQYMPLYNRRDLSGAELSDIESASEKIMPKIFKSKADPLTADMSSPMWSALGGGLVGSMLGGVAGSVIAPRSAAEYVSGLGAGIGGIAGAVIAAKRRQAKNQTLIEQMRRLPPGAVRRDLESDPAYQAELERNARIRAATIARGRYKRATAEGVKASTASGVAKALPVLKSVAGGAAGWFGTPAIVPEGMDPAELRNLQLKNMLLGGAILSPTVAKLSPLKKTLTREGLGLGAFGSNLYFINEAKKTDLQNRLASALEQATSSGTAERQANVQAAQSSAEASKAEARASLGTLVASAVLTSGILGALGYQAYKGRKEEKKRKGQIKVTLPTRQQDAESIVDIPLAALPEETYKSVLRDTKRRLREESQQRKKRKGKAVSDIQDASVLYDRFTQPAF